MRAGQIAKPREENLPFRFVSGREFKETRRDCPFLRFYHFKDVSHGTLPLLPKRSFFRSKTPDVTVVLPELLGKQRYRRIRIKSSIRSPANRQGHIDNQRGGEMIAGNASQKVALFVLFIFQSLTSFLKYGSNKYYSALFKIIEISKDKDK